MDRDVEIRWNELVAGVLSKAFDMVSWMTNGVLVVAKALTAATQAINARMKRHYTISNGLRREKIVELQREIDIWNTRDAWQRRNEP